MQHPESGRMNPEISAGPPLRATAGVMACELGDGLALLHHASGTFFVLDEVGSFIWRRLANPVTAEDLAEAVKEAYDAAPDQVDRDVRDFVESMVVADLIDIEASPQ